MFTNVVHFPENRICAKQAFNWSVCFRLCGGTTTACTWNRSWSVTMTTSCALLTSHGIVCTAPGLKTSWTSFLFVLVYRRFPLRSLPGWCVLKWSTESLSCPNSADKVFLQLPGYDDSFKSDSMALYMVQYAISHVFLVLISHILLISIVLKYYISIAIYIALYKSYILLLFIVPSVSYLICSWSLWSVSFSCKSICTYKYFCVHFYICRLFALCQSFVLNGILF